MMDKYYTKVKIADFGWEIGYQDKLMLIGSCFTENIGEKLERVKFQVNLNPFGIIYNPRSVAKSIRLLMSDKTYRQDDLFEHEGIWGSFDHHGRFSSTVASETLSKINRQLNISREFLQKADLLIITFGTSWVYELKATGALVSNCHKFPAGDFNRYRLTPDAIVDEYQNLLADLWEFNNDLKVLFTVSPIRHWKDGAVGNQLSKASLLLAVDQLIHVYGKQRCAYFPSYEIVMDELRDYRFYAPDLLHLSSEAVDHIWDKFCTLLISENTQSLVNDVLKIVKAIEHRPFNSESEGYKKFLLYNLNEIGKLTINFPYLNLADEKRIIETKLNEYQEGSVR